MNNVKCIGQLEELDWIRGLSALLIVLYHYTTQYQTLFGHVESWPIMVSWGCGAVNVFFLLTGFLTIYVLRFGTTPAEFAWKKAKRLYPAYWICIAITSAIMALFLPEYLRNAKEILVNVTMLQNFMGIRNVDGVYWTLSYNLIFYFYISILLLFKTATLKWVRNISLAWIGVSIGFYALKAVGISNALMSVVRLILMPYFTAPFAGGMLLAAAAKEQKRGFLTYGGVLASIILSFSVQETSYAVLYCIAVVLIIILIEKKIIFKNKAYVCKINQVSRCMKPLIFVARISYPVYLLHQFIGFAIIKKMESVGFCHEVFIIIPITIVLCLAYFVQKTVDRLIAIGKKNP